MKRYITLYSLMVLLMTAILSGCASDEDAGQSLSTEIALSADTVHIGPDGGDVDITVTSSGNWRLSGEYDWIAPSKTSGANGETITFSINANQTNANRAASFKVFTGASVAKLTILSETSYYLQLEEDKDIDITTNGGDLFLRLHTNIPDLKVTFPENADWLIFKEQIEALGYTKLWIQISQNKTYYNRNVTFNIEGQNLTAEAHIIQAQTDTILTDTKELLFNDLTQRNVTIPIETNVGFTVTSKPDWATVGDIVVPEQFSKVNIPVSLEKGIATRSGIIELSYSYGKKLHIAVKQKNPHPLYAHIPDNALKNGLINQSWLSSEDLNGENEILENGLKATELIVQNAGVSSLEGIEAFPNLNKINVRVNNLKVIDLSSMSKITSLDCNYNRDISRIILGNNQIESFKLTSSYLDSSDLIISGKYLKTLDLGFEDWYGADKISSIDVSGCPNLQSLDCRRNNMKTVYIKKGQTIPDLKKNADTKIVEK